MATTLIYERILELNGSTYTTSMWPGTLAQLEAQHPNHNIYLYEPPIITAPTLPEGEEPIITPTVYPSQWTPVDPIIAICIPQ